MRLTEVVDAVHRVEEVEVELGLEVRAALRARGTAAAPPAAAAATATAEEAAEQVAQVADVLEVDGLTLEAAREPARHRRRSCPGPTPLATISRTWSYSLRFSASPSTSCAAEISLKRSSAAVSPWFASGWYCFASLR